MQTDDLREIDKFFLQAEEPAKSCLLALRDFILGFDKNISEVWRYRMPFYCHKEKRFCYLWIQKRTGWPYLGIVDGKKITHPGLISEKRSRMKIFLIDPERDIPMATINVLIKKAVK